MRKPILDPVINYVSFNELKFPKIVYKYRTVNDIYHKSILTEQSVYFAPPITFEDELDCRIQERFDLLNDEDIYNQYYKMLQQQNPTVDTEVIKNEVVKWTSLGMLKDKVRLQAMEEFFWEEFNERFGVLSLTKNNHSLRMWTKYADDFNGFCVGFKPEILFSRAGGGGIVNYVKDLPLIHPFDSPETKRNLLTFYKLLKWKFEGEYRLQKMWDHPITIKERKVIIPSEGFSRLILGQNVTNDLRIEITKQAKLINPNINISIAVKNNGKVYLRPLL